MKTLFGLQIAGGYSSEAKVFAHLLGNAPEGAVNARVLMHSQLEVEDQVKQFARASRCEVVPFDTGWRINKTDNPGTPDRLLVGAHFTLNTTKITRFALEVPVDVIYSNQQKYDCRAATCVARRLDKPQIIHLHYKIGPWLGNAVLKRLTTCDHVITVSDFVRDEALRHGVAPERITTVRNAMNPMPLVTETEADLVRRELGLPADAFVFCNVSRLDDGKGHKDIIEAFSLLAPDAPEAWLVIVGSGPLDDELRDQAARSNARSRIIFAGHRADVPKILGTVNAFVHPSLQDACPLAILEAMASGLPAIAYAEGGAVEMLGDATTGSLVPSGDITALSDAMRYLYENPDRASRIGKAARERISTDLRPDRASKQFAEVVNRVCA